MHEVTLGAIPLFESLTNSELAEVIGHASEIDLPRGEIIIREGESGSTMYLLLSGKLRVYVSDGDNREFVLATLGPGECVGELAALDDEPRTATVETEEPSRVLLIHKPDFLSLLQKHPQIQFKLLMNLVRRTRSLTESVKNLALKDVYSRVRILLESLAEESGDVRMLPEPMTQQAIADRVGSSREMVARIMKELVFGGYVRLDNRRLILLHKLPEAF